MDGDPVIPPPLADDDDDVAWALQTAAIQWQRGARADAVVWLRRAVDAAIDAGNPSRTKDLTRLAASVADRLVAEAMMAPDSAAPPPPSHPPSQVVESLDEALGADPAASSWPPPGPGSSTLHGQIPIDIDEGESDDLDDDAPTLPPPSPRGEGPSSDYPSDMPGAIPVPVRSNAPPESDQFDEDTSPLDVESPEVEVGEIDDTDHDDDIELLASGPPGQDETAGAPVVDGVSLSQVRGFEDFPEETQGRLARTAVLTELAADEEVGAFGAALVTRGRVGIMPGVADVAAAVASVGEVVFTRGTLDEGIVLRVVALEDATVVASWSTDELAAATAACPWVEDELRAVADRFQALAGAMLGPLGDRLDDSLRGLVLSRLDVKAYGPSEIIVAQGKPVPGLHVIGAGNIELLDGERVAEEHSAGDFLFAAEVFAAGAAHATARAGKKGALILFAPRSVAHELLVGVPPLLEILSS